MAYLRAGGDRFAGFRGPLAGTTFLARFESFIARYGHRGRYESDWAQPRMHEEPAAALFAIRALLDGPSQDMQALARRQDADAARALDAFAARLTPWQRWTLQPRVRATLRRLKQHYLWREQVR